MSNGEEAQNRISPTERPVAGPNIPETKVTREKAEAKELHDTSKKRTVLRKALPKQREEQPASDEIDQMPDTPKPAEAKPFVDPKTVEKATGFLGKAGEKLAGGFGKAMEGFGKLMEKFAPILEKLTSALDSVKEKLARNMGATLVSLQGENKLMAGMRANLESFLGVYGIFYKNAAKRKVELTFKENESAKPFISLYEEAVTGGVKDNFDKFFLDVSDKAKTNVHAVKTAKGGTKIPFVEFMKVARTVRSEKEKDQKTKDAELAKKAKEEEKKKEENKDEEKKKEPETKIA